MSWAHSQLDQSKIQETELRFFQLNWDIKLTQPKFALKFLRKDFYLLILREIQTDQNLVFIFHDRHIFLALLVK